ncbi:MAG: hypothetical protein M0017_01680 [Desulfobacteraceae bacterium]|nr:hypothetical protein [Desulfobacteraceae bacterium]
MATSKAKRAIEEIEALYDQRLEDFLREKLGYSEETIRNTRPRRRKRPEKTIRLRR